MSKIEFEQHYQKWESSELSKAGYCKQENLVYTWFMYHCKRLQKMEQGFTQIQVKTKSNTLTNSVGIEYHFADGSYFIFPANCSVQFIRLLID